jgi:hypothetical protein
MQAYDVDEKGRRTQAKAQGVAKSQGAAPAEDEAPPRVWAKPHETGVIEVDLVARSAVPLVQLIAVVLWVLSLIGTYVPFAGGWDVVLVKLWPPLSAALWLALGTQIPLSLGQWAFKSRAILWWRNRDRYGVIAVQTSLGWWAAYAVALVLSAAFSAVTYGQWIVPLLTGLGPAWAAWIIIGIAAILGDMLPEWIMIRD